MRASGRPRRRIWPWIVVPLLIVAAAPVAAALLLPDGRGLSNEETYSIR